MLLVASLCGVVLCAALPFRFPCHILELSGQVEALEQAASSAMAAQDMDQSCSNFPFFGSFSLAWRSREQTSQTLKRLCTVLLRVMAAMSGPRSLSQTTLVFGAFGEDRDPPPCAENKEAFFNANQEQAAAGQRWTNDAGQGSLTQIVSSVCEMRQVMSSVVWS